jgi:two-component system, OmpR family, copper resistance phosphate regulon response regulator CusR
MRVLVVEDDRKVASFVAKGLREEGHAVDVAHDGVDGALKAHVYEYDLLLLDVMLPGKSGYEVVHELRREERHVPVLMLTARDSTADVVRGLDAGADDYLTKPFSFDELLARTRALVRRGGSGRAERLVYHDLELDRLRHVAYRAGEELDLTPREFQLLEYFMLHPEEVVRRTELLEKVWDLHFDPMSNVVDVHVGNLRRKLPAAGRGATVRTIRGVGFMLAGEERE